MRVNYLEHNVKTTKGEIVGNSLILRRNRSNRWADRMSEQLFGKQRAEFECLLEGRLQTTKGAINRLQIRRALSHPPTWYLIENMTSVDRND